MGALKGAAALGALALAAGRTLLRAEGGDQLGCTEGMKCCAPSRYMGWLDLAASEAACVSRESIGKACYNIEFNAQETHLHRLWVRADKVGQTCRPDGPVIYRDETTKRWQRLPAETPWAPGDVPPGGVGMHMIKGQAWLDWSALPAHWWPSLGPPCAGGGDAEGDERRGCFLYDFWHKAPMRELKGTGGGVDVHWHGGGSGYNHREVLHYDQGQKSPPIKSHQWPFPAFCARATASILSLAYNPEFSEKDIGAGQEVFWTRWKFKPSRCLKVDEDQYRKAIEQVKKGKACWNFVEHFKIVMCYRFLKCTCPQDRISECSREENVDCCRGAFADFLTEEGLVDHYRDLATQRNESWTLERMWHSWEQAAKPHSRLEQGKAVRLTGLHGTGLNFNFREGVLGRLNASAGRWEVRGQYDSSCPSGYKCCATAEEKGALSVCVRAKDIDVGVLWQVPACAAVPPRDRWARWDKVKGAHACNAGSPMFEKRGASKGAKVWHVLPDPTDGGLPQGDVGGEGGPHASLDARGKGNDKWLPLDATAGGSHDTKQAEWIASAKQSLRLLSGRAPARVKPDNLVLASEVIQLAISGDGVQKVASVPSTAPLRQVMDLYCQSVGVPASERDFLYRGDRIKRDATAASLHMQDRDTITVIKKTFKVVPPPAQ